MYAHHRIVASVCRALGLAAWGALLFWGTPSAWAGDVITKPAPARSSDAKYQSVELFAGVQSGKLEARLIPRDSKKARIFVTNKTSEPLNVRMPVVFVGKPVLAQFAPAGGGNQSNQGPMNGNMPQTIGGPTGRGGPGNGPAMFNVPPEKTAEFRVDCVCLEHGKPDPRPLVTYKLLPAEEAASPETVAMLAEFGRSEYSQRAAQAAAWHLANSMSWEKLAGLRSELLSLNLREPYFTREELDDAHKLVDAARAAVQSQPATALPKQPAVVPSPGTQTSLAR